MPNLAQSYKFIVNATQTYHKGFNVYHNFKDVKTILESLTVAKPPWWSDKFEEFVEKFKTTQFLVQLPEKDFPIIVVEGLDGVGKSTVTKHLCKKLDGRLFATPPPDLSNLREVFRNEPEPISRAFYSAANYIAATDIVLASAFAPVVVDRWWGSTCAMALAAKFSEDITKLPPEGHEVYEWPKDLPKYDLGILLDANEEIRRNRVTNRGGERQEEKDLGENKALRDCAMEAYRRMGYQTVDVYNYMYGVNGILDKMAELPKVKKRKMKLQRFSEEAAKKVTPY